jgi:hypothetical protein
MTQALPKPSKTSLYDQDLHLWLETAIAQLKAGDLNDLDIENLIEELDGLAGRDRRELKNRLRVLLEHLLKRLYIDMPQEFNGWQRTIREQRRQIELILEQSPSLRNIWIEYFDDQWRSAIKDVRAEYQKTTFPDVWQFSRDIDSLLNIDFWEKN